MKKQFGQPGVFSVQRLIKLLRELKGYVGKIGKGRAQARRNKKASKAQARTHK